MVNLKPAWEGYERFWVTFPLEDAKTLLAEERVIWAYHPTNRNLKNLIKNLFLAWRVLRRERPDVVISTGAGVAVPFLWIGKLLGMKTVYLECITRIHSISLAGRMILPVVDKFYGQWEEIAALHPKIDYEGRNV